LSTAPAPTQTGGRFLVPGYGVTVRGDGRSGGTLRMAELTATGRPGNVQLRLVDPETQNAAPGLGACTGDSGAPVFHRSGAGLELIGIVSWSTAPNNAAGCGGLTGVTPLALYRSWIIEAAGKLGSRLAG
jgi:secreted trypsin-like serine protease